MSYVKPGRGRGLGDDYDYRSMGDNTGAGNLTEAALIDSLNTQIKMSGKITSIFPVYVDYSNGTCGEGKAATKSGGCVSAPGWPYVCNIISYNAVQANKYPIDPTPVSIGLSVLSRNPIDLSQVTVTGTQQNNYGIPQPDANVYVYGKCSGTTPFWSYGKCYAVPAKWDLSKLAQDFGGCGPGYVKATPSSPCVKLPDGMAVIPGNLSTPADTSTPVYSTPATTVKSLTGEPCATYPSGGIAMRDNQYCWSKTEWAAMQNTNTVTGSTIKQVTVHLPDGSSITFKKDASGRYVGPNGATYDPTTHTITGADGSVYDTSGNKKTTTVGPVSAGLFGLPTWALIGGLGIAAVIVIVKKRKKSAATAVAAPPTATEVVKSNPGWNPRRRRR